ncbi:MAG: cytochrome b [Sphingomonas sp.]
MNARRYSMVAIWLHWLVAIGIIGNIALAWIWPAVADDQVRPLINAHKSIGITVLGLAILRLLWRFTHTPPALPGKYQRWEVRASHFTHLALYFLIFALPLTGWIMNSAWKEAPTHPMFYFGLFRWPSFLGVATLDPVTRETVHSIFGEAHEIAAKIVYVLLSLHVLGALKHQFLDGTRELQRMWFWGRAD